MCFRQHFKAAFVPVNMFRQLDWVENGLELWKGYWIRAIHSTFNWFIQIDPSSECLCGLYGRDWLLKQKKKLKISINLSISLLSWKNQCFAELRDVVNCDEFLMKAIVVTKASSSFIDSPTTFFNKKSHFSTRIPIQIAHDSALFDWKRIPEWRWSDDWVITGMERIENVSSPWRNNFPRRKAIPVCLSGAFPTSNSARCQCIHRFLIEDSAILGTNWMIGFWRWSHARRFEARAEKVKKTESFHQQSDLS